MHSVHDEYSLLDGVCHITHITRDVYPPALAEVFTDLFDKFVVFDRHGVAHARDGTPHDTRRAHKTAADEWQPRDLVSRAPTAWR